MQFEKNKTIPLLPHTSRKGKTFASLYKGVVLYFGLSLAPDDIAVRRIRQWLYRFELLGAATFTLGFLGLFFWQIVERNQLDRIMTAEYWLWAQDSLPILFWLGMLSICFFVYRKIAMHKEQRDIQFALFDGPEEAPQLTAEDIKRTPRKRRLDIARFYTPDAQRAIERSRHIATSFHASAILPAHVLLALLKDQRVAGVFIRLGISPKTVEAKVTQTMKKEPHRQQVQVSDDVYQILFHAFHNAFRAPQEYIDVTEVLLATVRQSEALQDVLYDLAIDKEKLANVIEWVRIRERLRRRYRQFRRAASHVSKHGVDRAMTAVATPFLNNFSHDLTIAAKFGHTQPCVARNKEIDEVLRTLESGNQGVVLVGDHGVGKMSIMEGIVERMIVGHVPKMLLEKRIVQLSTTSLLAGTTVAGAQERLLRMVHEIHRAGNVLLFINNIQDLMSAGSDGSGEGFDVSESLAEYLKGSGLVLFATTTPDGYNKHLLRSQIGTTLSKIDVAEMDDNQAIQVLESKVGGVEYKQRVFFSYDALAACVSMATRFLHDQYLPASALRVMTEVASYVRNKKGADQLVTADDVGAIVHEKTGIPLTSISDDESSKLLALEKEMHERVIGQDEAVSLVANALRRARAEIRSQKRPIANFLFLGPTGVGKTELAKTIASTYFGGEDRMVRIDMSEFQDKAAIYRLIGQPGQQGTGMLTEAVRQNPFTLVLLDEMEKADPDILNLFLQVFDDGRLTDSVGRVIDFTNTIIIATSNAATAYVQGQITQGVELETIRQALIHGELKQYYRPEFLNRFDGIVLFRALERDDIKKIASLLLARVAKDIEKRGVELRVEDAGLEALADIGFDKEFGARPMRRAIQEKIENQLAELVLAGKIKRRDVVVVGEGCAVSVESPK